MNAALAKRLASDDVARLAASDALTAEDIEAWLAESITAVVQAQAVDAIRKAWRVQSSSEATQRRAHGLAFDQVAGQLDAKAEAAITALRDVAPQLPTDDPLGAEAVLDAGKGEERQAAITALQTLARLAQCHVTVSSSLPMQLRHLAPVVDTADVGPQPVHMMSRAPIGDAHPQRQGISRCAHDATRRLSLDDLLVAVARGDYPGVRLAYAAERGTVRERLAKLDRALTHVASPHGEDAAIQAAALY